MPYDVDMTNNQLHKGEQVTQNYLSSLISEGVLTYFNGQGQKDISGAKYAFEYATVGDNVYLGRVGDIGVPFTFLCAISQVISFTKTEKVGN